MGREAGTTGKWTISSPFQFQSFHDFTSEVCRHIIVPWFRFKNAPVDRSRSFLGDASECAPEIYPRQLFEKRKFSKQKAEIENSCNLRNSRINQFDTSPLILPRDPREHRTSIFNAEHPGPDGHRASLLGVECSMLNVSICVQR